MNVQPTWSYETRLKADAVSVAVARDFVRVRLARHELWELVEDLSLVVSELATNAVVHAVTPFAVQLVGNDRSVRLTVSDASSGEVARRRSATLLDPGGRGLVIVGRLSQEWGVTAAVGGGKSVWASFDLDPTSPNGTCSAGPVNGKA